MHKSMGLCSVYVRECMWIYIICLYFFSDAIRVDLGCFLLAIGGVGSSAMAMLNSAKAGRKNTTAFQMIATRYQEVLWLIYVALFIKLFAVGIRDNFGKGRTMDKRLINFISRQNSICFAYWNIQSLEIEWNSDVMGYNLGWTTLRYAEPRQTIQINLSKKPIPCTCFSAQVYLHWKKKGYLLVAQKCCRHGHFLSVIWSMNVISVFHI